MRQRNFDGDHELYQFLRRKFGTENNKYIQAAQEFSKASADFDSIDDALHYFSARPEIIELGKVAIVINILKTELDSKLKIDRDIGRPNLGRLLDTWYRVLFSIAIAGSKKEEVTGLFENVTFINFNYDRTLEYYLYYALTDSVGVDAELAFQIVSQLDVIRPYGTVGSLSARSLQAPLGSDDVSEAMFSLSSGIRTFTEAHQEKMEKDIKDVLDVANVVVFLGFGFHGQNMKLLMTEDHATRGRDHSLFVTAKGIHQQNLGTLSGQMAESFGYAPSRIRILDMTAYELMSTQRISIESLTRKTR